MQSDMQLPSRRDVEMHAFLMGELSHGGTEERLRRVGHPVTEGGDRLTAPLPEMCLVVDEQRSAVLLG